MCIRDSPYTIRVVSEILESNGSSSQASICAGCMALMAAGVPIKAPVAGIAMGLITNGDDYTILTDIQGMEDHLGDMDFKVAGTKDGICALQMDIKIKGITKQILKEALQQAKKARAQILEVITNQISEPRKEVSKYAPKTVTFNIDPNKIKDVIGKGGDMITKIILEASNVKAVTDVNAVKVDLEDDGRVIIYHSDQNIIDKTMEMIKEVVREVEDGVIYKGRVVKVEDFGCFVELWPGCEGLVHVSQLDTKRVEKPSDIVKVGDEILVKSLGFDKRGRLNLSRKEAIKNIDSSVDLLIVDIGLPDGDGINLYQELQKNGRIPAIFLTAKDDEKDMLKAFDTGADDYVVKPFSIKVLLKRIEVVLKRKSNENIFMCGQVMLYSDRKQVFVGETEISLTLKEYQLLEYFIMNQNQVLTKEMIMENIWGIDSEFIDPNTISVMISRLKKKLNDSSNVISNVFGMGYRMGE